MNKGKAEITFVGRCVPVTHTYTVSKVILRERDSLDNSRTFDVNGKGIWIERKE